MKISKTLGCFAALSLILGLGLACGGKGKSDPPGFGKVDLVLANEGLDREIRSVSLQITGVEVRNSDKAWVPVALSTPSRSVDVTAIPVEAVLRGAELPVGNYFGLRFKLGAANTVKLAGGVQRDLDVPEYLVTNQNLFKVGKDATTKVVSLVQATQAIRPSGTGNRFKLHDHMLYSNEFNDAPRDGSLSGTLTGEGGLPIANATVTAQMSENGDSGMYLIARTTSTGADGRYTLDLLPRNSRYTYRVLGQAGVHGSESLGYKVSGPIAGGLPPQEVDLRVAVTHAPLAKVQVTALPASKPLEYHSAYVYKDIKLDGSAKGHPSICFGSRRIIDSSFNAFTVDVPPGTYHAWAWAYGMTSTKIERPGGVKAELVTVAAGETKSVRVEPVH